MISSSMKQTIVIEPSSSISRLRAGGTGKSALDDEVRTKNATMAAHRELIAAVHWGSVIGDESCRLDQKVFLFLLMSSPFFLGSLFKELEEEAEEGGDDDHDDDDDDDDDDENDVDDADDDDDDDDGKHAEEVEAQAYSPRRVSKTRTAYCSRRVHETSISASSAT